MLTISRSSRDHGGENLGFSSLASTAEPLAMAAHLLPGARNLKVKAKVKTDR